MRKIILSLLIAIIYVSPVWAEGRFVQKVTDGHELHLLNGDIINLIGLNISEDIANNNDVEMGSNEFLRGLVSGSVIDLEYDVIKEDKDGNLLGYVWFEYEFSDPFEIFEFPDNYVVHIREGSDGYPRFFVFLNATMIKSGYAKPDTETANLKHSELFMELYDERNKTAKIAKGTAAENLQAAK